MHLLVSILSALFLQLVSSIAVDSSNSTYLFTQPVDHFDRTGNNNRQWSQRYMINSTFYRSGGPIFMITPGESPLLSYYTDSVHLASLAQSTGGMVVAIEHRFYGQSNPLPDLSGESLAYLTIDNVLEDFASFIRAIKTNPSSIFPMAVPKDTKVVFGGGSYAGNIAAWMRAKYPDLVEGAWASSAVVYGRLENYQYDQSYGHHLNVLGCGGCFAQAVKDLDDIFLSGDVQKIAEAQQKFGIPGLTTADSAALIAALVSSAANDPITQTGDPMDYAVCSYFADNKTNDSQPTSCLDRYAAATNGAIERLGLLPNMMLIMGNSSLGLDYTAVDQVSRTWYYQMCTWFGGWQVPPLKSTGLTAYRSELLNLDYWQGSCRKRFGPQIPVPVDVDAYNKKWFEILRGATNIYYTAGELEIWRDSTVATTQGNLLQSHRGSRIVVISGANHGQDMRLESELDLDSVKDARRIGNRLVSRWLGNKSRSRNNSVRSTSCA
ncbi:hypothetical protein LPJ75_002161 [Coemansia sp. RSA 2598]|nr:hypothetical protein LPJ75_002161 [Coemansia sp. RSA 2598]